LVGDFVGDLVVLGGGLKRRDRGLFIKKSPLFILGQTLTLTFLGPLFGL